MFRSMRRFKQQISQQDCDQVLTEQWRGVLSLLGDDGYPYGVPMDFLYDPDKKRIYFHGALAGHKIDAIRRYDKASFCVIDQGTRKEGDWALYFNSVIVFGRIRVIEDRQTTIDVARRLGLKYFPTVEMVDEDLARNLDRVACFELEIEHMTGKHVHEN